MSSTSGPCPGRRGRACSTCRPQARARRDPVGAADLTHVVASPVADRRISIEFLAVRDYRGPRGSEREVPMAFIQIIELVTSRPDEVEALMDEWRSATDGRRTAQRGTFTKDRERPDTFVQVVEFPSYEDAMANSELAETAAFATRLTELCDGPMAFRNLDVLRVEEM